MSAAQAQIMAPGPTYRRRKLAILPASPLKLLNTVDGQSYMLHNDPIFPKMAPVECETWSDLVHADPPVPVKVPENFIILCEEDNAWALQGDGVNPSFEDIRETLKIDRANLMMNAKSRASKDNLGTISDKVIMATVAVAGVMAVLVAMVVLTELIGKKASDLEEPAAIHQQIGETWKT